jgi:NAD-dependent DNA ligase
LKVNQFIRRLGVENASIKTLQNFGINTFNDLIHWRPNNSKSQIALYNELMNKVFTAPEIDILGSLDFDSIARKTFDKIIEHYGYDNVRRDGEDLLLGNNTLPAGVGEITLKKFLNDLERNISIMYMFISDERYNPLETTPDSSSAKSNGILNGQSFCFTGALNTMSRTEAQKKVTQLGGTFKPGVSKGLTYLVTNDTSSGTSKNKKAKELDIKIINEETFLGIINGTNETTVDEVMSL